MVIQPAKISAPIASMFVILKKQAVLIFLLITVSPFARLADAQAITGKDTVRLSEAYRLADKVQEKVWSGWRKAPFTTLLVSEDFEYLIKSKSKPDGFEELGWNQNLQSRVYFRKRTFDPKLLATFPAFDSTPVIVIGTAEKSGKNSTTWILTLLHEHFHQLQMSDPDYFREVDALGLANGDKSGMWMLNYPFPYESNKIVDIYSMLSNKLASLLAGAIKPQQTTDFWTGYRKLEQSLSPKDFKYLSFQLWQEGIARYTELRVAEMAAKTLKPSKQFAALKDFQTFKEAATGLRKSLFSELRPAALKDEKRVAFYPFGAAIGLLLDETNPDWKRLYIKRKFSLQTFAPYPQ